MRRAVVAGFALMFWPCAAWAQSPWEVQPSGTTERLRGLAVVNDQVAWASGNRSTCLRTADGGATWAKVAVDEPGDFDFRDVEAFDADRAYVLAIGPGAASRVFKATKLASGEVRLVRCYQNEDPKGFYDAIAFWDHDHGLALGDPVDGRFVIEATDDAGRSWSQLSDPGTMPPALPGEAAFAASGTCLVVGPADQAWFATGGAAKARIFRSIDRGRSWKAFEAPIRAGSPSRGVFGLAFTSSMLGAAVGGDYKATTEADANFAATQVNGIDWGKTPPKRPTGFRSGVAIVPGRPTPTLTTVGQDGIKASIPGRPTATLITVGPGGSELGDNLGEDWRPLGGAEGYHAVAVAPSGRLAWAVGEGGKIGRLDVPKAIRGK